MKNPFESGHIKNYILFYIGVVVIMILFFVASTLFTDKKEIPKKVFNTKVDKKEDVVENKNSATKFKLIDVNY